MPLGVPAPGETALTVAVKVTDWPNTEGLTELTTEVEVEAGGRAGEVAVAVVGRRDRVRADAERARAEAADAAAQDAAANAVDAVQESDAARRRP